MAVVVDKNCLACCIVGVLTITDGHVKYGIC